MARPKASIKKRRRLAGTCKSGARRKGPARVLTLVLMLLGAGAASALRPPSELVGQRACTRLVLRLLECLIEASDLHVASSADDDQADGQHADDRPGTRAETAAGPAPDGNEFHLHGDERRAAATNSRGRLAGAVRPLGPQWEGPAGPRGQLPDEELVDYLRSTRPMDWRQTSPAAGAPAIKWLREQLFAIKMRLTAAAPSRGPPAEGPLAGALAALAELEHHLSGSCPSGPAGRLAARPAHSEPGHKRQLSLDFIWEALEVLAELGREARRRQQGRTGSLGPLDEREACDTVKRHYAYLTQIITAYDLLFNEPDGELLVGS